VWAPEWKAWTGLATDRPVAQKSAIELLEARADDIIEPPATELMALLRSLRTTVNSTANTEIRPDGTTSVAFQQDAKVRGSANGEATIPAEIKVGIPVLKGHVGQDGGPVRYQVMVRLRATVDDSAH